MRAFDNWDSYLDNDGNLLHGKVRFCRKGTTDEVIIYANDGGTPLRNPVFTDMLGRTQYQVFVAGDVSAYFYRYIGNGDMMGTDPEDYNTTRWAFQYKADSVDPVNDITVTAKGAEGVANMTALRAKDVSTVSEIDGKKMLWLYGYYAAGDTAPVLYVWDSASLKNDDGGAVIMPTNVSGPGRWILASREYIFDVRHFGIFPQADKYSVDYSYTSQLSNCADYLTAEGLNAWFPEINNSLGYYLLDGTNTFAITGDIYMGDGARFIIKSGTSGTAISCNRLYKAAPGLFDCSVQTGLGTLTADNINISWLGGQVTGNARVSWTIDTDSYARVITGKKVIFETNGNASLQLDNCQVESHKAITGNIVMQNMALKTEWFSDSYNWSNLSLSNCTVQLRDCKDADTYILLKNKMGQVDYGDLGEQTVTNAQFGAGCIVENCGGSATFAGDAELHNVTLTVTLTGQTPVWNCVDSWLTISGTPTFSLLSMSRGSIGGSSGINVLNTLKCENATLDNSVNILGGTLLLTDCVINGAISHVGNPIQENVRGCIFNNSISFRGGQADSTVMAVWQDNVGFVANPILFDRTNLAMLDSAHTYTYSGNTGTFPPSFDGASFQRTLTVTDTFATATQNDDYVEITQDVQTAPATLHFREDALYDYTNPTFNHGFSGTVDFFRIGTDVFPVRVDWRVVSSSFENGAFSAAPLPFRMIAVFSAGFGWKLVVYKGTYDIGGNNTHDTHVALWLLSASSSLDGTTFTGQFTLSR